MNYIIYICIHINGEINNIPNFDIISEGEKNGIYGK